ncbi:MAG: hypothetical protein WB947_07275 [Thermoplasmata archaeon]
MSISNKGKRRLIGLSLGIAVGMVLALVLSSVFLVSAPRSASPSAALNPASGSTEQWAFGGYASAAISCTTPAACLGAGNTTGFSSLSLSESYNISWAVIYTQTNVSSTQTEEEAQAALGATASFSLSECYTANASPCQTASLGLNLNGKEYGVGFTNLTTGTVDLTAGTGSPANVAAQAITNAWSSELYNFSGSANINVPAEDGSPAESENLNFDIGGNETSQISFATPLGLVPLSPVPGDAWMSNASYSASGGYTSGFSLSYSIDGQSNSSGDWSSAAVSPSGTLFLNGTDLGTYTLVDNYVNPPTSVTAQVILLTFSTGDEFSASDGYVLFPVGLFAGIVGDLAEPQSPLMPAATLPSQTSAGGNESAYYEGGVGFVGASLSTGSITSPISEPGATSPNIKLSAGPEPVSVAQSQYSGILTSSSSSSSAGYPWMWIIVAVVVVLVIVGVSVALVMRSRRRRQPPAATPPPYMGAPGYPAPPPPGGPGSP